MNIVILIGRLTRDPNFSNGTLKFTLAIDRGAAQDGVKRTDYPSVTVFGKQAESGYKYLHKGKQVAVQGSIQTGSYTDHNGKTVYTQEVIARRVKYLDSMSTQPAEQIAPPEADGFEDVDGGLPF